MPSSAPPDTHENTTALMAMGLTLESSEPSQDLGIWLVLSVAAPLTRQTQGPEAALSATE